MHLEGLQNTGTRAMKGKQRGEGVFFPFHEKIHSISGMFLEEKNLFTEYGIFFSLHHSKLYVAFYGEKKELTCDFLPLSCLNVSPAHRQQRDTRGGWHWSVRQQWRGDGKSSLWSDQGGQKPSLSELNTTWANTAPTRLLIPLLLCTSKKQPSPPSPFY